MIYQICDAIISIITWYWVHFWISLSNYNSLTHQPWSIGWYEQGQYFIQIFSTISRTGAKFHAYFNLATCSNYSITSSVKFGVFHFFERVIILFKLGFTSCKAEEPLRGMELQEKKHKKDYRIQKICLERSYS